MRNSKMSLRFRRIAAMGVAASLLFTDAAPMFAEKGTGGEGTFLFGTDITEEALKETLKADEALYPDGRFEFFQSQLTAKEGEKQQLVIVRRGGVDQKATVDFKAVDISAAYGEDYLLTVEESDHVLRTLEGSGKPLTDFNNSQMEVKEQEAQERMTPLEPVKEKSENGRKKASAIKGKAEKNALNQAKDTYLGTESGGLNWQEMDESRRMEAEAFSEACEDAYDAFAGEVFGQEYTFTFQEGEYMKSVYIDTIDDDISESDEQVMFLLGDASVGEVEGAKTAYLNIVDNDETEKAVFAMAAQNMTVDRSEGVARITINRISGENKIASVIVGTGSADAVSGTDYKAVKQEVLFAQGITEQTVEIPLLNYEGAKETAQFQVALDANESYVQQGAAVTTVTLTNETPVQSQEEQNPAAAKDVSARAASGWNDVRNVNAIASVSRKKQTGSGRRLILSGLDLSTAERIQITWKSDEGSRYYEYTTGKGCNKKTNRVTDRSRKSVIYLNDNAVLTKNTYFGQRTDNITLNDSMRTSNANLKLEVRTEGENDTATARVSKVVIHYPGYQFSVTNTAYTENGYGNQYTEKIYTDAASATKTDENGHKYQEGNTIMLGTLQVSSGNGVFSDSVTIHRPCEKIVFKTKYSTNKTSNGVQIKEGTSGNIYLAGYQLMQRNGRSWSKLIAPEDIKLTKSFLNTYKNYLLSGNEFRIRPVYRPYQTRVMFQNSDEKKGSYTNGFKKNEVLRCTMLDTIRVTGIAKTGNSVSGFNLGMYKDGGIHSSSNSANALAGKANAYYAQEKSYAEAQTKKFSAGNYTKSSVNTAVKNAAVGNVVTFSPTGEYIYINPTYSVPTVKVKIDPLSNNKDKGSVLYSKKDDSGSVAEDDVLMGDYRTPMEIKGVTLNQEYTLNAVTEDQYKAYFKNFTGDINEDGKITTAEEKTVASYDFVRTASNGNAYTFRPVLDKSLIYYGFNPTVANRYSGYIDGIVQLRDKPVFGSKETVTAVNGAQISVAGQTAVTKYDAQFGGVKENGGDGYFSIGSKDFTAGENQTVNISYNNLHLTATQAVNEAGIYELDAYDTIGINEANVYRVCDDQAESISVNDISNGDQIYRLGIQTYSKNDTVRAKKATFRFYRKDKSPLENATREVISDNGVFVLDFNPSALGIPSGAYMTVQFADQNGTEYFEHEMGFSFSQSLGILSFLSSFNFGGAEKAIEIIGVVDSAFDFGWDGNIDNIATSGEDGSLKTISVGFKFDKDKDWNNEDEEDDDKKDDKKEAIKEAAKNSGTGSEQKKKQKQAADDAVDASGKKNKSKLKLGAAAEVEMKFGLEINIAKSQDEEHLGEWYFQDMTLAATVDGGVNVSISYITPIGLPIRVAISAGGSGAATFILEQNYDKKEYYFSDVMDTEAEKIDLFRFNMNNGDRAFDGYGIFTVEPYIDLSAGAGFDFLNLMIGGRADFDMNFYTRSDQKNHGDVTFSAYISLKVLCFKKKWNFAKKKLNMFGGAERLNDISGSQDYTYESLSVMETDKRSYRSRRSEWMGEETGRERIAAGQEGITETLLEQAVNPNPDIQMTVLPDQKYLAVFLDDSLDEDIYNCTHVYYSIGDGKTWTKPQIIENDGTLDDEPAIFDLGEKGIYVAWSSADRVLTKEDTVIDSLNSMNIHGAFFDVAAKTFGEVEEITKTSPYSYETEDEILMADNTADVKPHISYDETENKMLMFYTKTEYESTSDDEEGLVGDIAKPYSVMAYRVYDFAKGAWEETYDASEGMDADYEKAWYGQRFLDLAPLSVVEEELDGSGFWTKEPTFKAFEREKYEGEDGWIYEQEPIVIESETTTYNGLALLAYVLDYDGDPETETDRDIFVQIYDYKTNQFMHPIMVTTTPDLAESKVKFARSGDTTLLTYLAGNTLYALNLSYIVQYRLLKSEIDGREFYYINKKHPDNETEQEEHVYMPPVIVAGDAAFHGDEEEKSSASIVDYGVASSNNFVYAVWSQRATKAREGIDPTSQEALDAANRVAESQIYVARYDTMEAVITEPIQVTKEEGANYGAIGFVVEKGETGKLKLLATKAKSVTETLESEDETGEIIRKEILTEDTENKDLMALEFTPSSTLVVEDLKIEELRAGSDSAVSMTLYNDGVDTLQNLTLTVTGEDGAKICEQKLASAQAETGENTASNKLYGGKTYPVSFTISLGEEESGCAFTYQITDDAKQTLAEGTYRETIPVQLDIEEFEATQDERGTIHFRVGVANNGRRKTGAQKIWISRKIEGAEEAFQNIRAIETEDLLPGESAVYTADYTYGDYEEMFETFISEEDESFEAVTSFRAYVNEDSKSAQEEISMRATKEQRLKMTAIQNISIFDGVMKEIEASYQMKKGDVTQLNASVESIAYKGSRYEGTDDANNYDRFNTAGLKVMYVSDNENVLKVYDSGYVEAAGPGTANVTAYFMPSNNKTVYTAEDGSFEEDNFSYMPQEAMLIKKFAVQVNDPDTQKPGENQTEQKPAAVSRGKTYKAGGYSYKVTKLPSGKKAGTVTVTKGPGKSARTIRVKDSVTIGEKKFQVTAIGKGAFRNYKKAQKATIGKYVKTISDKAFAGCKKLKTITIRSSKISRTGKKAIDGIHKKAIIKVPAKKYGAYQKKFNARTGFRSGMKIKKK